MLCRNLIAASLYLMVSSLYANAQVVRSVFAKTSNEPEYNKSIYYGVENRLILSPEYNKKNIGIKTNKGTLSLPDKMYNWSEKVFIYNADGTGMATFYVFDSLKNIVLDSCNLEIKRIPNPRIVIILQRIKLGREGEISGGLIAVHDTPDLPIIRSHVISSEFRNKEASIKTSGILSNEVLTFLKNTRNGDTVYCKNAIVKVANDTTLRRIRLNEIVCYKINGVLYYHKRGVTADSLPSDMDW